MTYLRDYHVDAEEDAQLEKEFELALEVSARQAEEQQGAGAGSSTDHQAVSSTPPCSPSTRGDGPTASTLQAGGFLHLRSRLAHAKLHVHYCSPSRRAGVSWGTRSLV